MKLLQKFFERCGICGCLLFFAKRTYKGVSYGARFVDGESQSTCPKCSRRIFELSIQGKNLDKIDKIIKKEQEFQEKQKVSLCDR